VNQLGDAAAQPFALGPAAFERGGDAVDDAGVFELAKTPSICSSFRPAAEPV
jgi:hypothetical protein